MLFRSTLDKIYFTKNSKISICDKKLIFNDTCKTQKTLVTDNGSKKYKVECNNKKLKITTYLESFNDEFKKNIKAFNGIKYDFVDKLIKLNRDLAILSADLASPSPSKASSGLSIAQITIKMLKIANINDKISEY